MRYNFIQYVSLASHPVSQSERVELNSISSNVTTLLPLRVSTSKFADCRFKTDYSVPKVSTVRSCVALEILLSPRANVIDVRNVSFRRVDGFLTTLLRVRWRQFEIRARLDETRIQSVNTVSDFYLRALSPPSTLILARPSFLKCYLSRWWH